MFKVSRKEKDQPVRLCDLHRGETFMYGSNPNIFMKTTDYNNSNTVKCANLITGSLESIGEENMVKKVDCELVVYY